MVANTRPPPSHPMLPKVPKAKRYAEEWRNEDHESFDPLRHLRTPINPATGLSFEPDELWLAQEVAKLEKQDDR